MCHDVNHGLKYDKMKPKKFEIPTFLMRKFKTPDESGDSMTENNRFSVEQMLSKRNVFLIFAFLLVLLIIGAISFSPYVLWVAVVAYVSAFAVELLFSKVRKIPITYKAIISPLVLTLMLPPTIPLWMVAVGASFGTFFGKSVFGGEGKNIFNPAVVGILFLTISFPVDMLSQWIDPMTDALVAGATPLTSLNRTGNAGLSYWGLLLAQGPGTIGETFRLGIIAFGIILAFLKVIDWKIPVIYVGTVFLINLIGHAVLSDVFPEALPSILVGGLMFAAVFVATDPVTSPVTFKAKIWYGVGLALITVVIRTFATFQEGIIFAVIIMNAIAPLLDGEEPYRLETSGSEVTP